MHGLNNHEVVVGLAQYLELQRGDGGRQHGSEQLLVAVEPPLLDQQLVQICRWHPLFERELEARGAIATVTPEPSRILSTHEFQPQPERTAAAAAVEVGEILTLATPSVICVLDDGVLSTPAAPACPSTPHSLMKSKLLHERHVTRAHAVSVVTKFAMIADASSSCQGRPHRSQCMESQSSTAPDRSARQ
jgi:hypothetical protein